MIRYHKFLIALMLIGLLLLAACTLDLSYEKDVEEVDIIEEVWDILHEQYVDLEELDDERLLEGAIRGMVSEIEDPYTNYLGPQENALSLSELEGDFSGIGATLTMENDQLKVVAPIKDSPAAEAGIKPGDIILAVDGVDTSKMNLVEAVLNIRGKKGTPVTLKVLHPDEQEPVEIEIVRAEIKLPSVRWEMLSDRIAHITVTNFSNRTGSEFETALEEMKEEVVAAIVLDLRDNPGGIVDAAVEVAGQFLDGEMVIYALDNKGKKEEWYARSGGLALDIPLVVLVNEHSASASEVVAGALQDHERGWLVGVTTYGKGRMNLVNELNNGGSLYVTFARWFTPLGRQIDDIGITPDYQVEMTSEDIENELDPPLEVAVEYLRLKL